VPLVGLQLLHLLAGDGPDRLLLIDDGQQAAYAGRDTLADAGISLSGVAALLTEDHRSSGDVLRLATRMVGSDCHVDVQGEERRHLPGEPVRRRGQLPIVVSATDTAELEGALVTRLTEINDSEIFQGETAVLVATAADVEHLRGVLMRAALPVVDIAGVLLAGDRIVLGTYADAKGLAFDQVLMPGLRNAPEQLAGEHDAAYAERTARLRRLQYVGITRARHGLWLGYLDGTVDTGSTD
jgi:superfamily I DNA/RNA helicase